MCIGMTIYGYARCSTDESKQDVKRQVNELLSKYDISKGNMFFEYESGANDDRKQFNRMLKQLQQGDCVVTTEVSRLTRSTKHLCEVIELAKEKHIKLIIGDFIVDCSKGELDPMTDGMIKMMGVFAEMERNMIRARVKSGMAHARAKGIKLGRPTLTIEDLPNSFLKHYPKTLLPKGHENRLTMSDVIKLCDISRQTAYNYKAIYDDVYGLSLKQSQATQSSDSNIAKDTPKAKAKLHKITECAKKLGLTVDIYDEGIENISYNQLNEILDQLQFGTGDVLVSIRRKQYVVEVVIDNKELDVYLLSREDYENKYGYDIYDEEH